MEKIGVIGLGQIAQKAYLPVMAALQDQYEWHLTTRNKDKGQQLAAKYGFQQVHQTLAELIAVHPVAVFVHTPTATHGQIIRTLLSAGINVYVDKPVSTDVTEVQALYELAAKKGLLLTCGFNRRFAPAHQGLKALPNKQTIIANKVREQSAQTPEFAVFDLLIHSVDTALYLLDEPLIKQSGRLVVADGNLQQAYLTLESAHTQLYITNNLVGGANLEQVSVQTSQGLTNVNDLTHQITYQTAGEQRQERPDWEPTLISRGFQPLIMAFLAAVTKQQPNPVSPASAILSHQVCARLIKGEKVL